MADNNNSSVDKLIDALKKSGMNVDKSSISGGANGSVGSSEASAGGSGSAGAGASGSAGSGASSSTGESNKRSNKCANSSRGARGSHKGKDNSSPFGGIADEIGDSIKDKVPHFSDLEIETKVGERLSKFNFGTKAVLIVIAILVIGIAYWWFHPPLNIQSPDLWGVIVVVCVMVFAVCGGLSVITEHKEARADKGARKQGKASSGKGSASAGKGNGAGAGSGASASAGKDVGANGAPVNSSAKSSNKGSIHRKLCIIPVVILLIGAVGWLLSQSFFPGNAAKYSSVLKTESLDFSTDIAQVDYSQIPVIDHDAAEILGDKQMGTISEYVSQFEVDSLYSQINYQGKPVRVSPLNYADIFKWLTNRESGIPAYVVVDMTTQDAQVVRVSDIDSENGRGAGGGIRYSTSEPLARNIDRYVQLKYPTYMFDTKSFEIDEDGHPWWICPVQKRTIGLFGGETIDRVVLCDAVTGECQDMAIEDAPEWIDRAYPSDLLIQQFNWYGAYNSGWLNSWLGQSGVVKTTPGTSNNKSGYNYIVKDDDVWVYTGVTSATSDSSIVGFVLVNQRTQESHFYSVAGATEKSAMESAEGQVQNLRYSATFPILINVSNQPTYFMALKDSAGTVKKFAMLDIQRYQNVAVGDTVADCQKSYEALLSTNGVDLTSQNLKKTSGVISRMATAVIESNSHYYVTLQGQDAIYDFALPNMLNIVAYAVGDNISFSYIEGTTTNAVQEILSENANSGAGATASASGENSGSSSSGSSVTNNTNTNISSNASMTNTSATSNASSNASSTNTNASANNTNNTSTTTNASSAGTNNTTNTSNAN